MKKLILFIYLIFCTAILFAQNPEVETSQFQQVIQNDSNQFRLATYTVNSSEYTVDTLLVDIQPVKWLDSAEWRAFTKQLYNASMERQESLRQLFVQQRKQTDSYGQLYESIAGEGAILVEAKESINQLIQGEWNFIDRVSDDNIRRRDITIEGNQFIVNQNNKGAITITDDLTVLVSGIYPFDMEFKVLQNGFLRYDRGQRIMVLRK